MTQLLVPTHGALIGPLEKQYMHEAVESGWLTSGAWNTRFETLLQDFIGVKHVRTCNSGSSANLIALMTLTSKKLGERRLKPGDEVITVACGFPTTVNPILQAGCVPIFCDITIPEYNIDVKQLVLALSSRTKAVMLAHTLGNPFDERAVREFCNENKLWLVVDCCDALGAKSSGKGHVGTLGDIASLSFFPAHHITTGEGGAIFTNSGKLARIAESFRDWGRDCWCLTGHDNTCKKRFEQQHGSLPRGYDHKYTYSELGYNLKLTEIQAACGVAQMGRLREFVALRRLNWAFLWEALKDQPLTLPTGHTEASPFGFPIMLYGGRQSMMKHLEYRGIGTRLLFGGNLTKQPYMQGRNFRVVGSLENTDHVMNDLFWIGCWPGLSAMQLALSVEAIKEFFQ